MLLIYRLHELAFTNSANSLTDVMSRLMTIVIGVSAIAIALLWIPIAISFFSADEQKRYVAYSRARNAAIGTLIFVLAVSGTLYAVFHYIAVG
jgi:hypothetical protein